jgi:predicted PurR-regulated permease PerM
MGTGQCYPATSTTKFILVETDSKKREIAMSEEKSKPASPRWSSTFKMITGLTAAALILALLIYFRSIIGPLILAFILIYLLHPLAAFLNSHTRLSWRASVNIIYIFFLIILITSSTLTGLAAVQQIQSLIKVIERFVNDLPNLINKLSVEIIIIGPYRIDLSQYTNLGQFGTQVINALQSLLGRAGALAGTLATATVSTIARGFFVMIISYFVLADAGKVPSTLDYINIPGYSYDVQRISTALGRIWNAFLRGQLTIVIMVIFSYTILLSILGVRFAFAIAILAGLARFVPYVGPVINYIVLGLVTLFQGGNYFNLAPIYYTILAIGLSILMDQIYDNLVSPRIMGKSLGVHPAAVLVVAIIAANLIGIIGLVLAAPVLASVNLIARYTVNKMFDRDPWVDYKEEFEPMGLHWFGRLFNYLSVWWNSRKGDKVLK